MSRSNPKTLIYDQIARVGLALASGPRLELLELLGQGERSVDTLARLTGLRVANTSRHLQQLRQAGLVTARKEGQFVQYRLTGTEVTRLTLALCAVAEKHSAEVERLVKIFLVDKDALDPVPADEVLARARKGMVTILDVRPAEEFFAGHLPGAINIPVPEINKRLRELPRGREIIAYCRGPYCFMALEAVELLRKKGRKARRLQDGLPEWRSRGFPIETASS